MIFEYRKYVSTPGNLPTVHRRFEETTLGLFERYEFDVVGFWTPMHGGDPLHELHYILRWPDVPTMQKAWGQLVADPEWPAAVAKSEANGPTLATVESHLWAPTSYSPRG